LGLGGTLGVLADLVAALEMCAIAAWRRGGLRELLGFGVVYAAISTVLGGLMTALFSLFNRLGVDKMLGGEGENEGVSAWLFVLLAAISGGMALLGGRFFKRKSTRREGMLEIVYRGRSLRLKALCDSGNLLTDPISGKPCVIADTDEMERIFSLRVSRILKKGDIEHLDAKEARRVRAVPTRTVSGDTVLYAFRMDALRVDMGGGWREIDALVAFGNIGEGAEGARALIPSNIVFGVT
jgi:hypothetical protein